MLKAAAVAGKTTLSKPRFFLKVKFEGGWMNMELSLGKKKKEARGDHANRKTSNCNSPIRARA